MDDDLAEAAANMLVEHSILPSFEFNEMTEEEDDDDDEFEEDET
jgi:hypothetical protein